jgi:hypothetical protein
VTATSIRSSTTSGTTSRRTVRSMCARTTRPRLRGPSGRW